MLLPAAYRSRIFAKINVRISTVSPFVGGALAQVVVQHAKIAYSSCLYHSPAPPTTPLHVRPPIPILHRLVIHRLPSPLPRIIHAKFRRILPRKITRVTVIPIPHKRILALRSAEQRTRSSVPTGLRRGLLLHVQVHLALHVLRPFRTVVILVRLLQLAARVGQRVRPVNDVPIILVARVVLDRLLHALREERGDVHEAHHRALRPVRDVLPQVKRQIAHPLEIHDLQPSHEPVESILRARNPLAPSALIHE
mmetsp:Transcript_1949/g.4578  ORF Transcript_1949/g.4578 Transcript_1949/m.4578 type:complete len:252 (+) Transcript_1949:2471-3226(+)